jgi:hypothetical protein
MSGPKLGTQIPDPKRVAWGESNVKRKFVLLPRLGPVN